MHQNRHTCLPKTNFTYNNYLNTFNKYKQADIPITQIVSSTFAPSSIPQQSYSSNRPYQNRAASLPSKQILASVFPIKQPIRIQERPSESQRIRRNKIFEQRWSHLKEKNHYSPDKIQGKVNKFEQKSNIAIQCDPNFFQRKEIVTSEQNEVLASRAIMTFLQRNSQEKKKIQEQKRQLDEQRRKIEEERKREELRIKEAQKEKNNQRVYQKVIEKIIEHSNSNKKYQSNTEQELSKKDQEIAYLKLEVERLQRCDRLNKQNQTLYKRLVDTLREHSANTSFADTSSKKRKEQADFSASNITPMHDFSQIKKQSGDISLINRQSVIINKKGLNVVSKQSPNRSLPKQFVRSPAKPVSPMKRGENIEITMQPEEINTSKTVTFNRVNPRVNPHAKRVRQEQWVGVAKVYRNVNENFDNRVALGQAPITMRLGQINRQLERSMNARPRSSSKPRWNMLKEGYEQVLGRSYVFKPRVSMY